MPAKDRLLIPLTGHWSLLTGHWSPVRKANKYKAIDCCDVMVGMATGPTTQDLVEAQMELFKDCENRALRERFKQHLLKSYETMNPPTAAKEEIMESLCEIKKLRAEQEPVQPEKVSEDLLSCENIRKKFQ